MTILNLLLLIIILFLILISGFLSGSETAITAASKARIIRKIKKGSLVGIIGKIGSGKSSILYSILGETKLPPDHNTKIII